MVKKTLLNLVLILILFISLVACNTTTENKELKVLCDNINSLIQQEYNQIELKITTNIKGFELNANYILNNDEVTYYIEQFNTLPEDCNIENLSQSSKKIIEGILKVHNGQIIKDNNEDIDIPNYTELKGSFNFNEKNFENVEIETGKLKAEVISINEFLGVETSILKMKIEVNYTDYCLEKIVLLYKTSESTSTVEYNFKK